MTSTAREEGVCSPGSAVFQLTSTTLSLPWDSEMPTAVVAVRPLAPTPPASVASSPESTALMSSSRPSSDASSEGGDDKLAEEGGSACGALLHATGAAVCG